MAVPGPTLQWSPPVGSRSPLRPANAQMKGYYRQCIVLVTSFAAEHSVATDKKLPSKCPVSVQEYTPGEDLSDSQLQNSVSVELDW